jgi:hypothetical protein
MLCKELPGGNPLNKKDLALKILKDPRGRQLIMRLLKSRTVRRIIVKQVTRRLRSR